MRKHVIVEGMDGSGKDTVIRDLLDLFMGHFSLHERASTSLGGPVTNLIDWVLNDLRDMPDNPPMIYNRHPLISEPIYADKRLVNPGLRGQWRNLTWVNMHRRIAAEHCILVICEPPFSAIHANLLRSPGGHMPGVIENAAELYGRYARLVWPGVTIRYNYRKDTPDSLVKTIRNSLGRKAA